MPVSPVILLTDALIFVLLGAALLFILYARRHAHLRAPWRHVSRRPLAMASAVVLLAFVLVGVLDSLHFRERLPAAAGDAAYSAEVLSVLDKVVMPLRERAERTYSAPLALYAYSKETVERPDGTQARTFPKLQHAGAGIAPEEHLQDISERTATGAALALAAWLLFVAVGLLAVARIRRASPMHLAARVARGETRMAWRTVLVTTAVLALLIGVGASLSANYHLFGTDQVGQDVLYKSLKSIRTGLVIGTVTTLVMLPFAVLLGIMAGYFRGWIDDVVQYIYTTLSSIPGVLLIAAAVLSLQLYMAKHAEAFSTVLERADIRLLFLCLILGITSWTGLARLLRGETLKLRQLDYVQAAQAMGVGHAGVLGRHILPNIMHIILITVVLDFSGLVLAEAVLTYVGVGVDPTTHSWGNMINSARLEMAREPMVWWNLGAAFVFMFALVLAANLFADAVRDAYDPRLRK